MLLKPSGAPLKTSSAGSGAGSTNADPVPIFFPAAPPFFLEHQPIFFGAPNQLFFRRSPI